jgi:hypothetical protein
VSKETALTILARLFEQLGQKYVETQGVEWSNLPGEARDYYIGAFVRQCAGLGEGRERARAGDSGANDQTGSDVVPSPRPTKSFAVWHPERDGEAGNWTYFHTRKAAFDWAQQWADEHHVTVEVDTRTRSPSRTTKETTMTVRPRPHD